MQKKVALVTGGTRGIGAEIVRFLVKQDYQVVANFAGNEQRAAKLAEETGCFIKKFDAGNFEDTQTAVNDIQNEIGDISILVNNAGITKDGMAHKMSYDDWDDVIKTNLGSCFNTCRAVLPKMRDNGFGRIINISSINGQKGQLGQANYAASKAGMIGFTKSIALENARKNITANVICPGYIETEMTGQMNPDVLESIVRQIPVGHMGATDDVANVVAFLASDQSSFITGAVLPVNGGQFMGG